MLMTLYKLSFNSWVES